MERVFADSGYWIALVNPRDNLHQKAHAVLRDLRPAQIVTTEMVLTEFLIVSVITDRAYVMRPQERYFRFGMPRRLL